MPLLPMASRAALVGRTLTATEMFSDTLALLEAIIVHDYNCNCQLEKPDAWLPDATHPGGE